MNELEEIKKYVMLINDILSKKEKENKQLNGNRVRMVYWLDEVWVLDKDTIKLFYNWADAYKYYKELGTLVLESYKKNNDRLKRPTVINDFAENTYFMDSNYPEFWINNQKDWQCQIFFEYEDCRLEKYFIS